MALITIVMILSFFMRGMAAPGLPKLHDSNPHISRAIAYHTALLDGQFPPMWAKEVLGGIGSPVMMLNYQLPYMLGELWHRAGMSYFDSYKFTLMLSFVLSGLVMYLALSSKFGKLSAWTGALIYSLAPYRFVDIYVRGALGESLTFIFPPLLIWGFATGSPALLVLGWAGLFLTHPLASAAFSAFFLGHTLLVGKRSEVLKRLKLFFGTFGVALLLSAFNLLPTLALTKYTYYSPGLSDTLLMFPTLTQLFHSKWGYGVSLPGPNDGMSFELGIVQWGVIVSGLIMVWKNKSNELRYLLGACMVSLFFILPISLPIYKLLNLSMVIDFPWRLLFCLVFGSAWIGALLFDKLVNKLTRKLLAVIVTILLVITSIPIAHTELYWHKTAAWFARETGDSYGEYAPLTRATRDSAPFWLRAETITGKAQVNMQKDLSNWQVYKVEARENSVVRINTSYFIGWQAKIDGRQIGIDLRQNDESKKSECYVTTRTQADIDDSGLIACHIEPGTHILEINYVAPTVQRVGNLLTLIGIGVYLWILSASYYQHITKRKQ